VSHAKRLTLSVLILSSTIFSASFVGSASPLKVDAPSRATLAKWIENYHRPSTVPVPANNPMTPQKTALGMALFFDPRLSGSGAISCASCHNPALEWQDGLAKGIGHRGTQLGRHTPTIIDAAWAEPLFWDGRAATLEDQAKGPLAAPAEMNMPHSDVIKRIKSITGYGQQFAAVFPGHDIDIDAVAMAIASYERTIVSAQAPFDRWVQSDDQAISPSAKRGFAIFNDKANCASCHSGWRFSDNGFHDIGLTSEDVGRAKIIPGVPVLEHAFKTPSLRNIDGRGPYMHDGSLASLEDVIDHYDHGFVQRPSLSPEVKQLHLSLRDKKDLVAFMYTLTSNDGGVTVPALPH
jgi:cytochrome c peroxidase